METLVAFGSEIKSLEGVDGRLKIGGYLVLFGSPGAYDATRLRDYFSRDTDFDIPASGASSTLYYHHGLNFTLKARSLGKAQLSIDDAGVWMEAELQARDEYEAKIQELVRQGKLGLSSGTASHLVERTAVRNAHGDEVHHIDRWPLGLDASLTPTPGEPRTAALCLKSLDELALERWDELAESSILTQDWEQAVLAEYIRVQARLSGVSFEMPAGLVEALKNAQWDESKHPRDWRGRWANGGGDRGTALAKSPAHTSSFTQGGQTTVDTNLGFEGIRNLWSHALSKEARESWGTPRRNDSLTPRGASLSDNLSFRMNGVTLIKDQLWLHERARRAFKVVDAVVGLGEGRRYPQKIPVEFLQMEPLGETLTDSRTSIVKKINLNANDGEVEFTAAHESWHVLENTLRFHLQNTDLTLEVLSKGLLEAIQDTDTYRYLEGGRSKTEQRFISPNGEIVIVPVNRKRMEYRLKPQELMARAFAQYVAIKSGDPSLQQQLESYTRSWGLKRYTQWPADEFRRIESKFDELFRSAGMID